MEECLEQVAVAMLVWRPDAHDGDLGVLGVVDDDDVIGKRARVEPLDVDARHAAQREGGTFVLQQDDRACLGNAAALPEVGLTDDLGGRLRIDVRIVEEAEAELVAEQPPRRHVDPCLVDPAGAQRGRR